MNDSDSPRRPRPQKLKNGTFFVKLVLSQMDRTHYFHLMDYEDQDLSSMPDRILCKDEYSELLAA